MEVLEVIYIILISGTLVHAVEDVEYVFLLCKLQASGRTVFKVNLKRIYLCRITVFPDPCQEY